VKKPISQHVRCTNNKTALILLTGCSRRAVSAVAVAVDIISLVDSGEAAVPSGQKHLTR